AVGRGRGWRSRSSRTSTLRMESNKRASLDVNAGAMRLFILEPIRPSLILLERLLGASVWPIPLRGGSKGESSCVGVRRFTQGHFFRNQNASDRPPDAG